MKKILALLLASGIALTLCGCSKKILHCDNCNKEIKVSQNHQMEEDWIIYCSDCEKALFGEEGLVPRAD